MSCKNFDCAVRIVHYPTNTSVSETGWYSGGGFKPLIDKCMKAIKIQIFLATKGIWSRKIIRTYLWDEKSYPYPDENVFDLDEILRKGQRKID